MEKIFIPGGFSDRLEQLELKLEKILGFINLQEKLGNNMVFFWLSRQISVDHIIIIFTEWS